MCEGVGATAPQQVGLRTGFPFPQGLRRAVGDCRGPPRCVGGERHLQGRPNVPSPEAPGPLPVLVPSLRPNVQATPSARCTPRGSQGAHRPGRPGDSPPSPHLLGAHRG